MNWCLTVAITFHDMLQVFFVVHGMGTTDIEAKLLQKLTKMRGAVLFEALLDLHKAYDPLDWNRCL